MYGPNDFNLFGRTTPMVSPQSGVLQVPAGAILVEPGILPGSVKQTEIASKNVEGQTKEIKKDSAHRGAPAHQTYNKKKKKVKKKKK